MGQGELHYCSAPHRVADEAAFREITILDELDQILGHVLVRHVWTVRTVPVIAGVHNIKLKQKQTKDVISRFSLDGRV